ncbi:hypothetical protein KSP40_PGU001644 [Platanthera guangdongensis]|uniref:Auxin-repressed protein n=1 Tax=Platanthera guangdongensis TaxID=2320717 RepID=A0ABR2MWP7_9ASPA
MLRGKISSKPLVISQDGEAGESRGSKLYQRSVSMPVTPNTPPTPTTPSSAKKINVWRSVFHPGPTSTHKSLLGSDLFDKPQPNSPTVYDWLYSDETRSKHK